MKISKLLEKLVEISNTLGDLEVKCSADCGTAFDHYIKEMPIHSVDLTTYKGETYVYLDADPDEE